MHDRNSHVMAFWLVVPLTIVGIGKAFHFPGQVALCYHEFLTSMRSTSTDVSRNCALCELVRLT